MSGGVIQVLCVLKHRAPLARGPSSCQTNFLKMDFCLCGAILNYKFAEIIFPVCDIFVIYLYSSSFRNIRYMPNLIRKAIIMTLQKCPYSYISHAEPLEIISVTYIYNTPQE
jgi:hypothetical protein